KGVVFEGSFQNEWDVQLHRSAQGLRRDGSAPDSNGTVIGHYRTTVTESSCRSHRSSGSTPVSFLQERSGILSATTIQSWRSSDSKPFRLRGEPSNDNPVD